MNTTIDGPDKPTVLIVDDARDNILLVTTILKGTYRTKVATDGLKALQAAVTPPYPHIILLDVEMPGMDGYETCTRLKASPQTAAIPVIFLTARSKIEDEERGLLLGAVDYIAKPISPPTLLARISTHLTLLNARRFLEDKNAYLEAEVARRTREISRVQDLTILAMALLAETRDNKTGHHILRTQHYVRILATRLRQHPRHAAFFDEAMIELLWKSAALHDIGKVGIPDAILCKPGILSAEEFETIKRHTVIGHDALMEAEREIGEHTSFLHFARDIACYHHERWDGSGYPEGLHGEDIPLAARLMAVADVYDALVTPRVYKPAVSHKEAVRAIRESSGKEFDPEVVAAFCEAEEEIRRIADAARR